MLIIDEAVGCDGSLVPHIIGDRGLKVGVFHSRLPLVSTLLFQHGAVGDFVGHGGASDLKGNKFVAQMGWSQRGNAFLFHVNKVARGEIDVDRRGNRVAFVIGAIFGAMEMERLDGILDKFSIDDKHAFDCFVQLLYAIREFHSHKVALFNISPKTVGWVNENGRRVYKFFDYTKAKSFKLVKHNPIEDVIALGRMFERYENLYIQAIAKECVSGYFTADQIYQLILSQNDK